MRRSHVHQAAPTSAEMSADLLDAAEAAEMLRCSVRTIRQLTYTGGLPHLKIGRRVFYPRPALAQWVADNTAHRPQPSIVPVPHVVGGAITHRPAVTYHITPPPKPVPPVVLDRNGCVTVDGLE